MFNIDFEQKKSKHKTSFLADTFARTVLNQVFPAMKNIGNNDINVIHYVNFRTKRLIDVIIRYKNILIPLALDLSIDTDLNATRILGFKAGYKFNISIKNDLFQSLIFDPTEFQPFDAENFIEFLGYDSIKFSLFHKHYYNKNNTPMKMKQQGSVRQLEDGTIQRDISFDADFQYLSSYTGFFFNFYSDSIEHKLKNNEKKGVVYYQLLPMAGKIAGSFSEDFDFWKTIENNPGMISEPFRIAIQNHYKVDDHVVPHFDSHIDLFNYYNENQERIKSISEMIKI